MVNAGWYTGDSVPLVLASAFAYGGTAQFFAGLMEMPRGNTFGFVAFCSFGAFWWTFALFVQFFAKGVPADFVAWWLVMWGVFTFYMWIGSLKLNRGVQSIFLALWITFFLLAAGDFTGNADAAPCRRLCWADHRGARLLRGGRRGHQRNPRPHRAAARRAADQVRTPLRRGPAPSEHLFALEEIPRGKTLTGLAAETRLGRIDWPNDWLRRSLVTKAGFGG